MIQLDGTIEPTAYGYQCVASVVVDEDSDGDQLGWALLALQQTLTRTIAASLTLSDAHEPTPDYVPEDVAPPSE